MSVRIPREFHLLLFLAFFLLPTSAAGTERKVKSLVSSATIYPDRAMITRVVKEQIAAGDQMLVLSDMPVGLLDNTVRVAGAGDSPVKILDVRVMTVFLDTIPEDRIRELQNRLKTLRNDEQKIYDGLSILRSQKEFVDSLRISSAREGGTSGTQFDNWERVLSFIAKKLDVIYSEMRGLNASLADVKSKIEAVEREIRHSQAFSKKSQKQIVVAVRAARQAEVIMEVSYVVVGASWSPIYEMRVPSVSGTLQLTYSAMIRQNTGEDWKEIDLILSTARPSAGGMAPELSPMYVDIYQPPPLPQPMAARKSRDLQQPQELAVDARVAAKAPAVEFELPIAGVETQATSVTFKSPVKANIPSDNNPHKVTLRMEELNAEFRYVAAPKVSPFAYLTAKVKNKTEYPFLSGMMNIFFENTFVASSPLKTIMPGDEFDAGLGLDERIRIERRLINRFTEYTGTFTRKTKIHYEFSIKVENTRDQQIELELSDQIPISRNEKIVVEVLSPSPRELKSDSEGILRWKLKLGKGEKRDLKLAYTVEYPSDLKIVGLE